MQPRRVLIANAWGSNRGDEAMLNALYRVIEKVWIGAQVDVAPFRDEGLDIERDMRVLRRRIGLNHYIEVPRALEWLLPEKPEQRLSENWPIDFHHSLKHCCVASQIDFVIHAPQGPSIGDLYHIKADVLRVLDAARSVATPYAIVGVSMGPFNDRDNPGDTTFEVLQNARGIIVREDISYNHVRQRYPGLTNLHSAIDVVFSYPLPRFSDVEQEVLSHRGLVDWLDGGTIGTCISLTPAKDPRNPFDSGHHLAAFSAFLYDVLRDTGRRILLFSHIRQDLPALRQIVANAPEPDRIRIFRLKWIRRYSAPQSDAWNFFITTRYHPTIFALQSNAVLQYQEPVQSRWHVGEARSW